MFNPAGLDVVVQSLSGGLFRLFSYATTDSRSTVLESGYFTNAASYGLKLESLIVVLGEAGASTESYLVRVTSIDPTGDATVVVDADLDTVEEELLDAIASETAARIAADNTLQSNIDTEETARESADTTLQANIDDEATTRSAADTTLQSNIDTEESARTTADTTLQNNIDAVDAAKQPLDSDLTAIAALTTATYGRSLLELADAAAARTIVELGNVTNDAQTKAAIVPNTAPSNAQLLIGNAGGTAYEPQSLTGDVTVTAAGIMAVGATKITNAMLNSDVFSTAHSWSGRQTYNLTPAYDLASSVLGVAILLPLDAATHTVAASKQFDHVRISQSDGSNNKFTIGASGVVNGFSAFLETLSDSDSTSNIYAGVFGVTNAGPGTSKAIHTQAFGSGTSAGVIFGGVAQVQPVATTDTGSGAWQVQLTGSVDDRASLIVPGATARVLYGFGTNVGPISVKTAMFQAWMATGSDSGARAFQILNNGGTELSWWTKDGNINIGGTSFGFGAALSVTGFMNVGTSGSPVGIFGHTGTNNLIFGSTSNHPIEVRTNNTEVLLIGVAGPIKLTAAGHWAANGTVATTMTSLGPTGSHTTIQEWFVVQNSAGTTRWIPAY